MSSLQIGSYFGVLFCIDKEINHMHPEEHAPLFVLMCLVQSIFTPRCSEEH